MSTVRIVLGRDEGRLTGTAELKLDRLSTLRDTPPCTVETVEHEQVRDPLAFTMTFWFAYPRRATIGEYGGAMGAAGLDAVASRLASDDVFDTLRRLAPWHLNTLTAGCTHQEALYFDGPYGRGPDLVRTPACPITGYRYGHRWLTRVLDDQALADMTTLGLTE